MFTQLRTITNVKKSNAQNIYTSVGIEKNVYILPL